MNPGRSRLIRFVAGFAFAILLCEALYYGVLLRTGAVEALLELSAQATGALLRSVGLDVSSAGRVLRLGATSVTVERGCDGLQPWFLFVSAALAFPVRWRARLKVALVGTLLLMALNLLRLSSLLWIADRAPEAFELAHVDLWQPAFLFATLGLWLVLVRSASPRAEVAHG